MAFLLTVVLEETGNMVGYQEQRRVRGQLAQILERFCGIREFQDGLVGYYDGDSYLPEDRFHRPHRSSQSHPVIIAPKVLSEPSGEQGVVASDQYRLH